MLPPGKNASSVLRTNVKYLLMKLKIEGVAEGFEVGKADGWSDGETGFLEGEADGIDGDLVGVFVGFLDGCIDGGGVFTTFTNRSMNIVIA